VGPGNNERGFGIGRLCLWSLSQARRRWRALAAILTVMLLNVGLDVLKPWPMKVLVDQVISEQPMSPALVRALEFLPYGTTREGLLVWCVVGTVLIFLLVWGLGLASSLLNITFGQRMAYDLAADLFGHMQRLSLRFHSRKPVGDLVRRATADCASVAAVIQDALLPVLVSLVGLAVMFTVMWRLDPMLTLLALAVVPGMALVFWRYAGPMADESYKQQETEGGLYSVVEQTLSAIPIVQAFGREEDADRRFEAGSQATVGAALAAIDVQLRFKILMGLATTVGTAATLWVGANHVLDGRLSLGSVIVFLSYLASLYGPVETLMYTPSTIQGALGSVRRVQEVLAVEREIADRPGAYALAEVRGHVRLEDVTFGYEPGRPVLRQVTLDVQPGQAVAVVGPTGAGKTTLVSLVARFFDPWQGRITLDGHDLRDLQLQSLRAQVAVVLQEPFLFPLTIAENIAYGRPGASRHEIEAAACAANAHAFILRLPHCYDTAVGERGVTLSAGERQRVSIARALVKDAPILILDEPTGALDAETEALVVEALSRLRKGRTTFVIAHRLSTIREAEQIVVLDQGCVVEAGSHGELLARDGLYRRFHELQFDPSAALWRGLKTDPNAPDDSNTQTAFGSADRESL
jgi:ATP-binding cassette subfamily B protein/subfamily B ATP-binding cassette protein MsbA